MTWIDPENAYSSALSAPIEAVARTQSGLAGLAGAGVAHRSRSRVAKLGEVKLAPHPAAARVGRDRVLGSAARSSSTLSLQRARDDHQTNGAWE